MESSLQVYGSNTFKALSRSKLLMDKPAANGLA
jgi:hypothetical protein